MAITKVKQYLNGQTATTSGESEVGYSMYGGYQWATYKVDNMQPADQVTLNLKYSVISYNNIIGVVVNESSTHPGDSNTGKLSNPDVTFKSGEGRFSGDFHGWTDDCEVTLVINKKLSGGTYYIHISRQSAVNSSTPYVALDIYLSSILTVSALKTYTITYNFNNGSNGPTNSSKTHGSLLTLPTKIPTRTGYTFTGWNTASDGSGYSFSAGGIFNIDNNTTLYAQWKINTLTIQMNVNGGKKASDAAANMTIVNDIALFNQKSQTINYGTTFNLWDYNYAPWIKLTKAGYIVSSGKEFCTTNNGTGTTYNQATTYQISDFADITKGSKTITLYVNWKTGGIVHYSDGTQWIACQMYYSDGTNWYHVMPYYSDGAQWIQCT